MIYLIPNIPSIKTIYDQSEFDDSIQLTPIEIYKHAVRLKVNQKKFPQCSWSLDKDIHFCAGFCPWIPQKLVKCQFLPAIINPEFHRLGIYCEPPSDKCPTYDAYLKDTLPLTKSPIRYIPEDLLSNYSLGGLIDVKNGNQHDFVNTAIEPVWTEEYLAELRSQVRSRIPYGTYKTSILYPVLDAYADLAIKSKKCAVIGTQYPWIEAALLEYGAGSVLTVEYANIVVNVSRLSVISPHQYLAKQKANAKVNKYDQFDSIWSYSSIEHDGLGRYTDPMNPNGDFQTMVKISCMLKPGGLLFLAVPANEKDYLEFNLHRIYGPVRFPILFRNFHLVQAFINKVIDAPWIFDQPVLVLQNKVGCA